MSWSKGSSSWSWPEAPAVSKGKGKKGTKKGKQQPEDPEDWQWQQPESTERTWRIKSKYQLAHQLLKASADADGSAFVKDKKIDDFAFLSEKNLQRVVTADNCHLLRRPGVGLSEAASSLQAGIEVLDSLDQVGLQGLHVLLQQRELVEALQVLNTTDRSVEERTPDAMREALKTLRKCLTKSSDLEELAIKATVFASRLFLLGAHLLPLRVCLGDLEWWAEKVPETLSEHPRFRAWKGNPKSSKKMLEAMAALLQEKLEAAAEYGKNDAASVFGRKSKRPTEASSRSGSSGKKKSKKDKDSKDKKKKKDKKDQKNKKRTRSSSESRSSKSEKEEKQKKKDKKERKSKGRSRSASKASTQKSKQEEGSEAPTPEAPNSPR